MSMAFPAGGQPLLPEKKDLNRLSFPLFAISTAAFLLAAYGFLPSLQNPYYMAGAIAYFFLSYYHPIYAFYLVLILLPFTVLSLSVGTSLIFIGEALFGVLFFAWLIKNIILGKEQVLPIYQSSLCFVFVGLSLASTLGAFGAVFNDVFQTFGMFLFAPLLCTNLLRTEKDLNRAATVIIVSGIIAVTFGFLEHYTGGGRLKGLLGEPNTAAAFFLMTFSFLLASFFYSENLIKKIILLGFSVAMVVGTLWTQSRAGMVGIIAVFGGFALQKGMRHALAYFFLVFLGYTFSSHLFSQDLIERFSSITDLSSTNTGWRDYQYASALIVMEREPLFGSGIGNLLNYTTLHRDEKLVFQVGLVHNIFLHIGAERGIPALLVFFGIYAKLLSVTFGFGRRPLPAALKKIFVSCFGLFFSFLIVNQSAYFLYKGTGLLFGLSMGLVAVAKRLADDFEKAATPNDMLFYAPFPVDRGWRVSHLGSPSL